MSTFKIDIFLISKTEILVNFLDYYVIHLTAQID
jgi:hypothetical protein